MVGVCHGVVVLARWTSNQTGMKERERETRKERDIERRERKERQETQERERERSVDLISVRTNIHINVYGQRHLL